MENYYTLDPNEVVIPEEEQQKIREVDYIGKKRVIVYHQNEKFKVCNKNNEYYVSNYGKIYNVSKNKCIPTHIDKDGYERVSIRGKSYTVHRLILENFCPVDNMDSLQVNHINFNRSFNTYNPPVNNNLEWTTNLDNIRHSVAHGHLGGKPRFGEDNPNHKYTEKEVYKICELLSSNIYTDKQIAEQLGKEYNDSFKSLLCNIRNKTTWKPISSQFSNIQSNYKQHTEEEIYKICELLSSNIYTDKQIAEQLGKEYNNSFSSLLCNIRSKTTWKNISDNFPNICLEDIASIHKKEEIWKICELLSQNYTGKQIAEQLGKEYNGSFKSLLSNIRHKKYWADISDNFPNIQVYYNKNCNTEEEIYKICELMSQNYTGKQIAEQLGKEYDKKFKSLLCNIRSKTTWKNISDNFTNIQQLNCNHHHTKEEIYKICELLSSNIYTDKQIAEQLGKEYDKKFKCLLYKIKHKKNWKFISDQFLNI